MKVTSLKQLVVLLCYVLAKGEARTTQAPSDGKTTSAEPALITEDESGPVSNATELLGQTFNFSNLVEPTDTVQLTIANQTINMSAFTVDESNAGALQSMFEEHTLLDIMYIATKIARIEKKIADKVNRTLYLYDIIWRGTTSVMGQYFSDIWPKNMMQIIHHGARSIEESLALENIFDPDEDVVLTREDVDEMERAINQESKSTRRKRKAMNKQWSSPIPYYISVEFNSHMSGKRAIKEGIRHWEEETCLKFKPEVYTGGPILYFVYRSGCYTFLGRKPRGQHISIGHGCDTIGLVAHEIAHALGFWHEQSRPDRDKYVTIHYDNIRSSKMHNFYISSWSEAQTMGIPYDYSSLMQYYWKAFGWEKNTITSKEAGMNSVMGGATHLSFYDVKLANLIYCNSECEGGLLWERCSYEGYRDPKDCNRCKCPDGLSGDFCTSVKPGKGATCGNAELVASSEWQSLKSPNYGVSGLASYSECSWRIKLSGSSGRIVVRFIGRISFPCFTPCPAYVEVRHAELYRAGPRYCCDSTPTGQIVSHGSEMLILLRVNRNLDGWSDIDGFNLEYRSGPCGGCVSTRSLSVPSCVDTQAYSCPASYTGTCGNGKTCTRYRKNTCYKQVKTCCPGFTLSGDTCTQPCGGCSHSASRSGPPCQATQAYSCPISYTEHCGGFWFWSKTCTRYRKKTCYRQVQYCCAGFTLSGDMCIR